MFRKEKAKGSPRQRYGLWLFLGLALGITATVAIVLSLFEIRRSMIFTELASLHEGGSIGLSGFSPDGQLIFAPIHSDPLHVWQLSENQVIERQGISSRIDNIQWNTDNSQFIALDYDQSAMRFDRQGNLMNHYEQPGIIYAGWNPVGTRVLTYSQNVISFWSVDGMLLQGVSLPSSDITSSQWSPDGSRLLLLSGNHDAILFDMDGLVIQRLTFSGYPASIKWDNQSRTFATNQNAADILRQNITVYSRDGEMLWSREIDTNGFISLHWNPEGDRLIALDRGYSQTVHLWSLEGEELASFDSDTMLMEWHPENGTFLTDSLEADALEIRDRNGEIMQTLVHENALLSIEAKWSPDGTKLATWASIGNNRSSLRLWDTEGSLLHEILSSNRISDLVWSPDSSKILSYGSNLAQIWSVAEGDEINSLQHQHPIAHARWSTDSLRILTSGVYGPHRLIENAVWTSEGEHIATLFTGYMAGEIYVHDWNADFSQVLVGSINSLRVMQLQASPIFLDFRFDNP